MRFLSSMHPDWNISLFHYRNQGADYGRILVGLQVPKRDNAALRGFLESLAYPYEDETQNPVYKLFPALTEADAKSWTADASSSGLLQNPRATYRSPPSLMAIHRTLISPTANPELEKALRDRVDRRSAIAGGLGELEPLAVRLGLVQNTLTPRFRDPMLALFAADHGLVVDGIASLWGAQHPRADPDGACRNRLPVSVFARVQGLQLTVVDCGIAEPLPPNAKLLSRKIAHGTRNARVGHAMSLDQGERRHARGHGNRREPARQTCWPAPAWAKDPRKAPRWCCRAWPTARSGTSSSPAPTCGRTIWPICW